MIYLRLLLCLNIVLIYACSEKQTDKQSDKQNQKAKISHTEKQPEPIVDKSVPKKDRKAVANFKKYYNSKNKKPKKDKQIYQDFLNVKDQANVLGTKHLKFFQETYNFNKFKKLKRPKALSIPLSKNSHSAKLAKKYNCKSFADLNDLITKLINSIRDDQAKYGAHLAKKHKVKYDFKTIKKLQLEFTAALNKDLGLD